MWLLGERGLPPHIFASDVCRLPLYRRAAEFNADFWNHQAAEFNGMQASEAT
jgi:hypothetical protein